MAINKQSIISVFDDKLTLLQWLKTINKALDEAVLTGVEVRQKGNATFSFVVTFEDGTELESNQFVLAQGESINGATIRNGHLYLTLTNGDELDAGNVKPVTSFEINASQHLIVNYGDGTSQDLGAIFTGNINVDGNFTANSIIENMNGYAISNIASEINLIYGGACKNGNKITFVLFGDLYAETLPTAGFWRICNFTIPTEIGQKLFPYTQGGFDNLLNKTIVNLSTGVGVDANVNVSCIVQKYSNNTISFFMYSNNVQPTTHYIFRYEVTFLLSDNMAV